MSRGPLPCTGNLRAENVSCPVTDTGTHVFQEVFQPVAELLPPGLHDFFEGILCNKTPRRVEL